MALEREVQKRVADRRDAQQRRGHHQRAEARNDEQIGGGTH